VVPSGCPQQKCHSEVPCYPPSREFIKSHPEWSPGNLPQLIRAPASPKLFPVSAWKILCAIVRGPTALKSLGLSLWLLLGPAEYKKGRDLLFQSPWGEKRGKWAGIIERDIFDPSRPGCADG
jgi:hypothetical protein